MAPDHERLLALAEAISDGRPVPWSETESATEDDGELMLVRHLRLVAGVASVHRAEKPRDVLDPSPPSWGALAIIECVGTGSFGSVYKARDTRLDRDVALKLLHRDGGDEMASLLIAEGRRLARVRHPHVISVYGADWIEGRAGIWMELIEGRTLEQILSADGPFGPREAALIGLDLCGALAAVHAQGLVHRDVKAQNVMREDGGRVVLMDFGGGQEQSEKSDTRIVGTPAYMAPEVLRGEAATTASDIYGLGVLLFRLVTGKYPITAPSLDGWVRAHEEQQRPRLSDIRPELPLSFVKVVERALATEPGARFQSVGAMQAELSATIVPERAPAGARVDGRGALGTALSAPRAYVFIFLGVLASLLGYRWLYGAPPARLDVIGVSTLRHLSRDSGQQYLSDGVTEVILDAVGRLGTKRIVRLGTLPAAEANVDAVIEGAVTGPPDRMQVMVRLVRAGSGDVLWNRTYEKALGEIGVFERQIGEDLSRELLGRAPRVRVKEHYQASAQAQDAYFRGWAEVESYSRPTAAKAIEYFERAVELDPGYALAHAALSHAYYTAGVTFKLLPTADAYARSKREALRSLELDPELPRGLAALGQSEMYFEWAWGSAEQHLAKAVSLAPSDGRIRHQYASLLAASARIGPALSEIRQATELDPASFAARLGLASNLYYARRYHESIDVYQALRSQDPNLRPPHLGLAKNYIMLNEHRRALEAIDLGRFRDEPAVAVDVVRARALGGEFDLARQLVERLRTRVQSGELAPDYFAAALVTVGDQEEALRYLRLAVDQRSPSAVWIQVDPRFDTLRDDTRFAALLRAIGFER